MRNLLIYLILILGFIFYLSVILEINFVCFEFSDNADVFKIKEICLNRPLPNNLRADVWRICLRIDVCSKEVINFDDTPDLENDEQLCLDCADTAQQIFDAITEDTHFNQIQLSNISLDSDDDKDANFNIIDIEKLSSVQSTHSVQKITSDLKFVVTKFAKTYSMNYFSNNGWLSMIKALFIVFNPADKTDLYCIFISFYHRFIATGTNIDQYLCSIFRLLLQYHEPKLSIYLDSMNLGPETYLSTWLSSVFADVVSNDVLFSLWDIYILKSDPFFGFLIALVLVINAKSSLLNHSIELNVENTEQVNSNEVDRGESFDI